MTARRNESRRRRSAAFVLFLLAVFAGSLWPAVSISSTELAERPAAASEDPGKVLEGGPWLLLEVNGAIVQLPAGERQPSLLFLRQERRMKGYSGCNEFSGSIDLRGGALTFGVLASTRRACGGPAGDVEQAFFVALSKVRGWRMDRQILLLIDGDQVLARLRQERRSTQQ
jgi:heat shock protein HslJ